jgi:hypothetical protein
VPADVMADNHPSSAYVICCLVRVQTRVRDSERGVGDGLAGLIRSKLSAPPAMGRNDAIASTQGKEEQGGRTES